MNTETLIRSLEAARCSAIVERDIAALDALIADDLVHVHGNGGTDDKTAYLRGIDQKYDFHELTRGDLNIRVYGVAAVVTGPLRQSFSLKGEAERHQVQGMSTQVWVLSGSTWRLTTCHNQFLAQG